jgi:hypothetical protein
MKKVIDVINISAYKKNEIKPDDDIITALNIMIKNKIDFSNLINSKNHNGLNEYIVNTIKSIDEKIKNIRSK